MTDKLTLLTVLIYSVCLYLYFLFVKYGETVVTLQIIIICHSDYGRLCGKQQIYKM